MWGGGGGDRVLGYPRLDRLGWPSGHRARKLGGSSTTLAPANQAAAGFASKSCSMVMMYQKERPRNT